MTTNFNPNPNWYCANIHAGLYLKMNFAGALHVSPCIIYKQWYPVNSDQLFFNHPILEDIRKNHKQTNQLSGPCKKCDPLLCDGTGLPNRSSANLSYVKDQLLYDQPGPKLITIQISTLCNLACTTCGPSASSKWRSMGKNKFANTALSKIVASPREDTIRTAMKNINFQNLETLHILGGEPFLDSIHEVVLEELLRYGKNITIHYDTNGTQFPSPRTMKLWKMFKLVRVKFSIDGVKESFEYLRWPAKWNLVEQNMLDMVQQLPSNVMFSLRPAMGFLNFHVVGDIRDWYKKNIPTNREGDPTEIEYNGVNGVFSGSFITHEFKQELNAIYDSSDPIHSIIPKMPDTDPKNLINIKNALEKIDKLRGTDYKTSLPHITQYLEN